jgi:hypothetical protein
MQTITAQQQDIFSRVGVNGLNNYCMIGSCANLASPYTQKMINGICQILSLGVLQTYR